MTTVGHTLMGLALRNLSAPGNRSPWIVLAEMAAFCAAANAMDWPLQGWGHRAYNVSHSIFVMPVAMVLLSPVPVQILVKLGYGFKGAAWLWAGMTAAALSHLLLDTLYAPGGGLAMFWPVSGARLALPIPFLHQLRPEEGYFAPHNLKVFAIEGVFFGLIFAASVVARRRLAARASRSRPPA
jgi:membrane-bound metal-dependent hydrolase YbcI (DUF457 family)